MNYYILKSSDFKNKMMNDTWIRIKNIEIIYSEHAPFWNTEARRFINTGLIWQYRSLLHYLKLGNWPPRSPDITLSDFFL